jgi:hypothetical protein
MNSSRPIRIFHLNRLQAPMPERPPFWKTKRLHEMTRVEFEAICDGCARCCLVKIEDADTGVVHYTDVACRLLDGKSCRCKDYGHRRRRVPDCLKITPRTAKVIRLAPADLRLQAARGGQGPLLVAPARLGRSRHGAPGRHFRARARGGLRGRFFRRRNGAPAGYLAGAISRGRQAQIAAPGRAETGRETAQAARVRQTEGGTRRGLICAFA